MHRVRTFALAVLLTCSCDTSPEPTAQVASAMYVDQTTGHGPVPCSGSTPDHGYLDVWHPPDTCTRVRGDFIGDSQFIHAGYIFTPGTDVSWVFMSQNYTHGQVCSHAATGPAYAPCLNQSPAPITLVAGWNFIPWQPVAVVLWYLPPCPNTPGMTRLRQCTGAWTPIDGSGYATAVIDDGNPAHALNLPNPPILAGDCYVELTDSALIAQFTPPPGYLHGNRVAAVYTCP